MISRHALGSQVGPPLPPAVTASRIKSVQLTCAEQKREPLSRHRRSKHQVGAQLDVGGRSSSFVEDLDSVVTLARFRDLRRDAEPWDQPVRQQPPGRDGGRDASPDSDDHTDHQLGHCIKPSAARHRCLRSPAESNGRTTSARSAIIRRKLMELWQGLRGSGNRTYGATERARSALIDRSAESAFAWLRAVWTIDLACPTTGSMSHTWRSASARSASRRRSRASASVGSVRARSPMGAGAAFSRATIALR